MCAAQPTVVNGKLYPEVMLTGKTVVITGSNTGIGLETASDLATRGAKIVMACRDIGKAEDAKKKILEKIADAQITIQKLDLSSLKSVRECAEKILEFETRIDILINNAGIMMCPPWKTKEGFEMQLGVNHIGHFLFTNLLLDLLKKSAPSRIVVVSSIMYKRGRMNWDDIMQERKYDAIKAYAASKLANILHASELSKRLEGTGVTCNVLHPGIIKSDLWRHTNDLSHLPLGSRIKMSIFGPIVHWRAISIEEGARTTIYCAVAPELEKVSGKFFENCAEESLQRHARSTDDAKKLWEISEKWTTTSEN